MFPWLTFTGGEATFQAWRNLHFCLWKREQTFHLFNQTAVCGWVITDQFCNLSVASLGWKARFTTGRTGNRDTCWYLVLARTQSLHIFLEGKIDLCSFYLIYSQIHTYGTQMTHLCTLNICSMRWAQGQGLLRMSHVFALLGINKPIQLSSCVHNEQSWLEKSDFLLNYDHKSKVKPVNKQCSPLFPVFVSLVDLRPAYPLSLTPNGLDLRVHNRLLVQPE